MKPNYYKSLIVGFFFSIHTVLWAESEEKVYSLAVVPQMSAVKIEQNWKPVLDVIEKRTGIVIRLLHSENIPLFEEKVVAGEPDFAYMNPYHAMRAYQIQGYDSIVRDKNKLLYGQLWVSAKSPIESLSDLEGKDIAFPAPNAFGASLYMRALLSEKEGISFSSRYVKTHSNVYRHVATGQTAAGGGVGRTYKAEPKALQKSIRLLYQTPGVRPHPLCAHKRVDSSVAEKVTQVLVALGQGSEQEKALVSALGIPVPVAANYEEDYAPLSLLNLAKFSEGAMK